MATLTDDIMRINSKNPKLLGILSGVLLIYTITSSMNTANLNSVSAQINSQEPLKCIPPEVKVDPFVCGIPGGPGGAPPGGAGQDMLSQTMVKCTPPEVEVSEGKCGIPSRRWKCR